MDDDLRDSYAGELKVNADLLDRVHELEDEIDKREREEDAELFRRRAAIATLKRTIREEEEYLCRLPAAKRLRLVNSYELLLVGWDKNYGHRIPAPKKFDDAAKLVREFARTHQLEVCVECPLCAPYPKCDPPIKFRLYWKESSSCAPWKAVILITSDSINAKLSHHASKLAVIWYSTGECDSDELDAFLSDCEYSPAAREFLTTVVTHLRLKIPAACYATLHSTHWHSLAPPFSVDLDL